ncbi:GerAB/ArcD/ProY family transporter [Paenibacillus cymbidii]|uniref:GerAB/ArcD/ProY family transporter n=1 Tax=Paenibacillus cymbidii TaxID=1639034 RepID=UPI0010821EBD|nr:endospore germination permease [Paenibacillus cymbidii]
MNRFEFGDRQISGSEMAITIMSMIVGVGILTLPRSLAAATLSSDGLLSIAFAGLLALPAGWLLAKLAVRMGRTAYYPFASALVTKPVAMLVVAVTALYFLLFCAYEVKAVANIAMQYLFERTPIEVVALSFLLVVFYAAAGERASLIRLNVLFMPLVLLIVLALLLFSQNNFFFVNLQPFFVTGWRQIASGAGQTVFSLLGMEVVLFYTAMMAKPKLAPPMTLIGIAMPVVLYLLIYMLCIGIFSQPALREVQYPTIELAKEARIPGEFFERFESLFFVTWIMTIFNSTTMMLDLAAETCRSLFGKRRFAWLLALSPLVYIIAMTPRDEADFERFGKWVSYGGIAVGICLPVLLLLVAKLRGVRAHD